jgi:hypothetical protein
VQIFINKFKRNRFRIVKKRNTFAQI